MARTPFPGLVALWLMSPAPLWADVYDQLSGLFGDPAFPPESCLENPVHSKFTADRSRVVFSWARPVESYTGAYITAFAGTVTAQDQTGITMLRDDETRLTADGAQIQWQMRVTAAPQGYCWRRLDWPDEECVQLLRCDPAANS